MIDSHMHYLRPEWLDALWSPDIRRNSSLWPRVFLQMPTLTDPAALLYALDARGVERGMLLPELSIAPGPQTPGGQAAALALTRAMNDATAALVARHPDRFGGYAVINPFGDEADILELRRAYSALRLRGVAVGATYRGETIASPAAHRMLAEIEFLGLPLLVHPTAGGGWQQPRDFGLDLLLGVPWDLAATALKLILTGTLDAFPRLRIILPHLGLGLPALLSWCESNAPEHATALRQGMHRFWLDTATATSPTISQALALTGAEHVLFASDWPMSPERDPADLLAGLPLGPDGRANILHENAARLFWG
jgi:predicted TIM-barrel fold metal-dependent hydrolase